MARVTIEEALLREPNLWTPRKQPVGTVALDLSHPITKNLIHYHLLNEPEGANIIRDYAHAEQSTAVGTPTWHVDSGGRYMAFDTNANYVALPTGDVLDGAYTVIFWMIHNGDAFEKIWAKQGLGTNTKIETQDTATGRWQWQHPFSTTDLRMEPSTSYPLNEWFMWAVTHTGSTSYTDCIGYYNGIAQPANAGQSQNGSGSHDDYASVEIRVGFTGTESLRNHMIFNRVLSQPEIMSLYLDPYQIFKPA